MGRKKTRRQKNEEFKRRYDAIKNLMSTFAMSTVAVVAVVTLIPASPKAEITKATALSEEIAYQVTVTDEENALDLDTLFVVLENQLEYYEVPIELGEHSGYFENLNHNTQYQLSIYGSKGFGQERLDTVTLTTREKVGATILSVTPFGDEHEPSYSVDYRLYDPDLKYSAFTLYYGYSSGHIEDELTYSSVDITNSISPYEIHDIWTFDPFHIYIEGTTVDGTEILDEIWVTPPVVVNAEIYLNSIQQNAVGFHVYSYSDVEGLQYKIITYRNGTEMSNQTFTIDTEVFEDSQITVDGLRKDTDYVFETYIIYQNPNTLRTEEKLYSTEEVRTLKDYSYTYSKTVYDTYIEVSIELDDPNDYFQRVTADIYDTSGEFPHWHSNVTELFIIDGDSKTITFSIDITDLDSYQINIEISNNTEFLINETVDKIKSN